MAHRMDRVAGGRTKTWAQGHMSGMSGSSISTALVARTPSPAPSGRMEHSMRSSWNFYPTTKRTVQHRLMNIMVRPTRCRANETEGVPIITDTHVKVTATTATVQFPGFFGEKSSHRPFPLLEAARTVRPMAPINDRTKMMENTTRLGMRLGSALRRLYFNAELGQR